MMTKSDYYVPVTWPEIQDYMLEDDFENNSYLISDDKGLDDFGSSSYFVNLEWKESIDKREVSDE